MNNKEINEMPVRELELKLRQTKAELMALRTKKSAGQLEKPHMLKALRQQSARILTAINAKARHAQAKDEDAKKEVKKETKETKKIIFKFKGKAKK